MFCMHNAIANMNAWNELYLSYKLKSIIDTAEWWLIWSAAHYNKGLGFNFHLSLILKWCLIYVGRVRCDLVCIVYSCPSNLIVVCSVQQGHRPVSDLFQALWERLSHRPALLQTGDQGRLWPVHCRDVRQCSVWTDWRKAIAEDQLDGN